MISEAPWDTEEWSNDYAITGINYILKYIIIENIQTVHNIAIFTVFLIE